MTIGTFPFGQPIQRVAQHDRKPKHVFVLGVYASAVHARWCNVRGRQLVRALAVASEPCIFWRGDESGKEVIEILSKIDVSPQVGRLEPAARNLNGPSGRSLDEDYLKPLGLTRNEAWLCDLVPHSCMNSGQAKAVETHYTPLVKQHGLPDVDWPTVPGKLTDKARQKEIAAELRESTAQIVITLGDLPLKWFGAAFGSKGSLKAYGKDAESYGRLQNFDFEDRSLKLMPLVHPKQAAGLGGHNPQWKALHENWVRRTAPELVTYLKTG